MARQALRQGLTPAELLVQLLYNSFFMMESWTLAGQRALPAAHCCAVSKLLRRVANHFLHNMLMALAAVLVAVIRPSR
jgi:hypothetical protein